MRSLNLPRVASGRISSALLFGGALVLLFLALGAASLRGVVDLYTVPPLIMSLVCFLSLCARNRHKLSHMWQRGVFGGIYRASMIILILILLNRLALVKNQYWDLTESMKHTLAPESLQTLSRLKEPVEVRLFIKKGGLAGQLKNLLKLYSAASPLFSYSFIDPDIRPMEARKYGVKRYNTVLISGYSEGREKREILKRFSEAHLTAAIRRVSMGTNPRILFTAGSGEASIDDTGVDGFSDIAEALAQEGFLVDTFISGRGTGVPADTDLLIVAGPTRPLAGKEEIADYLARGGKCLFLVEPSPAPSMEDLLDPLGFVLPDALVIDKLSSVMGGEYFMPVATEYGDHDITADLNRAPSYFRIARPVYLKGLKQGELRYQALATTGTEAWADFDFEGDRVEYQEGRDRKGPIPLAVIAEGQGRRIAVVGDRDFICNQLLGRSANRDLFLNMASYLVRGSEGTTVTRSLDTYRGLILTEQSQRNLFIGLVLALPFILGASALAIRHLRG